MTRYVVTDRKRSHISLVARHGTGEFKIVRPVPASAVLEFDDAQQNTFSACLADLVAKGELAIANDVA